MELNELAIWVYMAIGTSFCSSLRYAYSKDSIKLFCKNHNQPDQLIFRMK